MLRLARENAHARDLRVTFDEAAHEYSVDGRVIDGSVSSLWASRFEKFDAPSTARRCYKKWTRMAEEGTDKDAWTYTQKYITLVEGGAVSFGDRRNDDSQKGYGNLLKYFWGKGWDRDKCTREVTALWTRLGLEASERGTFVHRQAELHCNSEPYENGSENDPEIRQYERFRKDHPHLIPYRTEWSVFAYLGAFVVAGQIDGIYRDAAGHFHMIDYKCCAHELTAHNPYGKFGTFPFADVPDNSFGHYACQQNIYRFILENYYGIHLHSCHLLRVHSTIKEYELVEVPNLQSEVGSLFDALRRKTVFRNLKFKSTKEKSVRALKRTLTVITITVYLKKMSNSYSGSEEHKISAKASKRKRQVAEEAEDDEADDRSFSEPSDRSEYQEQKYDWWRSEYDLLCNKINEEGGFPAKAGNFWLHSGLSVMNDGKLTVTSKKGGPIETSDLIKETTSFYLQPQHDGQRVFAVFFGTATDRVDNTKFNDFKSTFRMRLDNVTQEDVVKFQGLPKFTLKSKDGVFTEHSNADVYKSIKNSTIYKILEKSFSLSLATQVAKGKLNKDHVKKGEDNNGVFVDKYIRERLGKIDQDDPYSVESTDFTWLKDKTKISLPLTKDEATGEFRTFINEASDEDKRSPTFEVELPIKPLSNSPVDFELKGNRGPKVTKVSPDGTKKRATVEDIVQDFPVKEQGATSNSGSKAVMVFVQYDSLQNGKYAGPGLRCNVREIAYVASKTQESVDDACARFNS